MPSYYNDQCCVYLIDNNSGEGLSWAEVTSTQEIAMLCDEDMFSGDSGNMSQVNIVHS